MIKITIIPGDGIGKEVMNAATHVLDSLELNLDYIYASAGYECFQKTGSTIPDETIKLTKKTSATLFGAVTTVPGHKSAIISLRKELDLYANIRPVKSYPGINSLFKDLDFVIIRENSEGLYSGLEDYTREGAVARRVITRRASERISRFAFDYAKKTGRKKVTAVHKANVLKKTDGVFKDSFYKVGEEYPDLEKEDFYVDATAMYFLTKPQIFDVLVTTNLFGDILSDEGAGLVGGLGLIPSANIGDKQGLFEPVHGSAPDIEGKGIANPVAMLLSTSMMLKYLKMEYEAENLEKAISAVLKNGKVVTPDLGGNYSTMDMAREVSKQIKIQNHS
ncbi:NAD-dependent isocitrate dehydrogenase [Methanobacterium alkalithermotolerans]|uniref:NAD-dependent isocitrate dehydrogenase n=1 Tax=Methanobacterium alkalithermotolerans TaxID=2731220 RepID=A0A8T8K672_9EURY|nr:homoisocitrate dehydrogenase [Methanobacterium alkalithermotolerans]QUH24086.1 NAD-dependent isocitrate dehydrogenase [Methanobacterium alkalithermotolerans]